MPSIWLPVMSTAVVLLLTTSLAEGPIKRALRGRWPAFDYDGQTLLAWGVAMLGAATMLIFLLLVLSRG